MNYLTIAWKVLKISAPILLLLGVLYVVFGAGSHRGQDIVQEKWDKEREQRRKDRLKQAAEIAKREQVNQKKDEEILNALVQLQTVEAGNAARISGELALRLRDSQINAARYLAAAEGTAAERSRLASHAARLDQALTEGVSLVDELKSTIEVRDGQLRQLGAQILNDRQLINGSGEADGIDEHAGSSEHASASASE